MVQTFCKTLWQYLTKSNICSPLLGFYWGEMKTYVHPKSFKRILIKVLFIKAQNKNSPHVHQLMKGYVYLYIHSMEYYTAIKKGTKYWDMLQLREYQDNLCWVEKHRQKNNIYSMIPFTRNSKNRQTPVIKVRSVVTWSWESGWVLNGAGGKFWCDCIHWLFYILIVSVFHNCIKLWKFIKLDT